VFERAPRPSSVALVHDTLFVGLTRPAMALGVPYVAVLANLLVTLELFLVTRNLLWLLAVLPLHGLTFLVCLAEPRFFDLLQVWALTRQRARSRGRPPWGVRSYSALANGGRGALRLVGREAP
jgi:type IV secretion system protein VirB3